MMMLMMLILTIMMMMVMMINADDERDSKYRDHFTWIEQQLASVHQHMQSSSDRFCNNHMELHLPDFSESGWHQRLTMT